MDSYMSSFHGSESMSLQEMLDLDMKTEKDLDDLFNSDTNLNFHELPPLNLDEDSLGAPGENNVWLTSANDGSSLLGGDVSNSIGSDLNVGENRMVSPNSVVPVTLIQVPHDKSHTKVLERITPKVTNFKLNKTASTFSAINRLSQYSNLIIKEELDVDDDDDEEEEEIDAEEEEEEEEGQSEAEIRRAILMKANHARGQIRVQQEAPTRTVANGTKRNISLKTVNSKHRRIQEYSSDNDLNLTSSAYPKPAYSYSCLIAMALKNSPSGSLPVSEIYNFMCEHFPYFKTAPNGWKNSVRHNLSLNKCFEKIEKPATNGSQRKGCLWAMNPNKINKMDEEVQKWSKKDKMGIYKSMINPGTLDALERGQLSGGMQSYSEADSDEDAWDSNPRTRHPWAAVKEEVTEEELEEEEEEDDKSWVRNGVASRLSPQHILAAINTNQDEYDSDISLTDFDIEVAESMCNNVRVASSPNGSFQPLLSGAYTGNSQRVGVKSPKRFKTIGGNTITGNYVYKPLGSSHIRRKSPMRHSLLSSLEADD